VYDVHHAEEHADGERDNGNKHDQQIAQAEEKERAVSLLPVLVGERQVVDDCRQRDADDRQTQRADQGDEQFQIGHGDGHEDWKKKPKLGKSMKKIKKLTFVS